MLAHGDSITAGHGVMTEEARPALLAQRSGWQVINAGVSGDTSGGALHRLSTLIVEHAQQHRARVVLLAIPRPSALGAATGRLAPAGFCAALGSRREVMLVNDAVSDVLSNAQLRLDPLHPNAAGHMALSEKLEKAFRAAGLLR